MTVFASKGFSQKEKNKECLKETGIKAMEYINEVRAELLIIKNKSEKEFISL